MILKVANRPEIIHTVPFCFVVLHISKEWALFWRSSLLTVAFCSYFLFHCFPNNTRAAFTSCPVIVLFNILHTLQNRDTFVSSIHHSTVLGWCVWLHSLCLVSDWLDRQLLSERTCGSLISSAADISQHQDSDRLSSPRRKQAHSCLFLLIYVCVLNLMILCLFQCISADERDLKTYLSNLPAFFEFSTLLRNSLLGHSPSRHATLLWPTDPFCVDRPVLLPPSLSIPIKIIHAYLWDCLGNWIIRKFPSGLCWTWLFLSSP